MQFYPAAAPTMAQGRAAEYYPGHAMHSGSPRMNWSPTMHPGAWPHYDFAYPAYPPTTSDPQRSPSYQLSAQDQQSSTTPHNIRDILGAQGALPPGMPPNSAPGDAAKSNEATYTSPTSTNSGVALLSPDHIRSPTTPGMQPKAPFEVIQYQDMPGSFYIPAMSRPPLPGKCNFKCSVSLTKPSALQCSVSFFTVLMLW